MPKHCRNCQHAYCDELAPGRPQWLCRYYPPREHVIDVIEMGVRVPEDGWCGQFQSTLAPHSLTARPPTAVSTAIRTRARHLAGIGAQLTLSRKRPVSSGPGGALTVPGRRVRPAARTRPFRQSRRPLLSNRT